MIVARTSGQNAIDTGGNPICNDDIFYWTDCLLFLAIVGGKMDNQLRKRGIGTSSGMTMDDKSQKKGGASHLDLEATGRDCREVTRSLLLAIT